MPNEFVRQSPSHFEELGTFIRDPYCLGINALTVFVVVKTSSRTKGLSRIISATGHRNKSPAA